ncbi:MAG: hypothetical protein DCC75_01680 [Proteobacteria bacterium]|nr:MAG: hypothetical protein DCC75_01680 [Pseudomonadota bacterium]
MSTPQSDHLRSTKLRLLGLLIAPVARYAVRNNNSFQDFIQVAKSWFITAAADELARNNQKVNASRLSVMTGLTRMEVKRLNFGNLAPPPTVDLFGRVLGKWRNDPVYASRAGEPKVLSMEQFRQLVLEISKDTSPGTVLFELERTGLVKKTSSGLKHTKMLYNVGQDTVKTFELLSTEIDAHIRGAEENTSCQPHLPNLHLVTEYDNVFLEDLPKIREWLIDQGKLFHRKARNFIARFDRDLAGSVKSSDRAAGGKVLLAAFSLTEPSPSEGPQAAASERG